MPLERLARRWLSGAALKPAGSRQIRVDTEVVVSAPLERTFGFFADAANLQRLTPPWVNFRIHTPLPIDMREGVEIDYRIVVRGLPLPWRSRIDVWEPGVRFVDRQVLGPYRWWRHEHLFAATPGGTRVTDRVEFEPRLRWATGRLVSRDVETIFAFRRQALQEIFARG